MSEMLTKKQFGRSATLRMTFFAAARFSPETAGIPYSLLFR